MIDKRRYGIIGGTYIPPERTRGQIPTRPEYITEPRTREEREINAFWRGLAMWAGNERDSHASNLSQRTRDNISALMRSAADRIRTASIYGYHTRPAVDPRDIPGNDDAEQTRQFARGYYAWTMSANPDQQLEYLKFLDEHALKYRAPEEFNQ